MGELIRFLHFATHCLEPHDMRGQVEFISSRMGDCRKLRLSRPLPADSIFLHMDSPIFGNDLRPWITTSVSNSGREPR